MVITAFKTNQDLYDTHNNPCLFNSPSTLRHLSLQFEDTQYLQWPLNTSFVGVVVVISTLLFSCAGRRLFLGLDDGGLPDCKRPNRNYL
jgi:multiple sugar transport system permease protein